MVLEEFLMKSVTWIAYGCTWILTGLYLMIDLTSKWVHGIL